MLRFAGFKKTSRLTSFSIFKEQKASPATRYAGRIRHAYCPLKCGAFEPCHHSFKHVKSASIPFEAGVTKSAARSEARMPK